MRVLQVNKLYNSVGGVESVVRSIATGIATRSYDSSVLAAVERGLGTQKTEEGVFIRTVGSLGRLQSVPISPQFPRYLHQMSSMTDVVHHHLPNPLGAVSHLIAAPRDVPTVCTYHSDIVRQSKSFRLYRPVLDRFLENVDYILPTSPALLNHSDVLSKFSEKCEVVPLGIDLDMIDRSADPPDHLSDNNIILFVGRLNYYKGVEYLVDAMATVDAHLIVVGDGPRRSSLTKQAADRGLTDRITFLGYIPDAELDSIYEAADVFVLPSVKPSEAFGIVQLEAMAHELPVVNTNLPSGVPWVSKHKETGLTVQPKEATLLANAINELLANENQRLAYGKSARERVETMFTRNQMLESITAIYEELND